MSHAINHRANNLLNIKCSNFARPFTGMMTKRIIKHMVDSEQIRNIRIEDFNYPLPDEKIAKFPLKEREQCKLLYYKDKKIEEYHFYDIPALLPSGSMLVYNNTRVINARLRFRKANHGALIEIFCLEPVAPRDYTQIFASTGNCTWSCFVGNAKRWKSEPLQQEINIHGETVTLTASRGLQHGNAFDVTFSWDNANITFASLPYSLPIVLIICLWIGYQIYYLITFKKSKSKSEIENESDSENKNTVKNTNFSKLLFYMAIIGWCLCFAQGIPIFFSNIMTGQRNIRVIRIHIKLVFICIYNYPNIANFFNIYCYLCHFE